MENVLMELHLYEYIGPLTCNYFKDALLYSLWHQQI